MSYFSDNEFSCRPLRNVCPATLAMLLPQCSQEEQAIIKKVGKLYTTTLILTCVPLRDTWANELACRDTPLNWFTISHVSMSKSISPIFLIPRHRCILNTHAKPIGWFRNQCGAWGAARRRVRRHSLAIHAVAKYLCISLGLTIWKPIDSCAHGKTDKWYYEHFGLHPSTPEWIHDKPIIANRKCSNVIMIMLVPMATIARSPLISVSFLMSIDFDRTTETRFADCPTTC